MTTPTPDAGVVILDKPAGITSHDAVARMRRVLGLRKVGHAGTLDPMATGVLVVGFGRGTRLLPYLQATAKQYTATIRLGVATTTDDRTGDPLRPTVPVSVDDAELDLLLAGFTGTIQQRPSAVSAVFVDGRRAYARVRGGEQVELAPRTVSVMRLRRTGPARPTEARGLDVDVVVTCSSGTYIRALARDLGETIGCGGHLAALRRDAVGPFDLHAAAALPAPDDPAPLALRLGEAAAAVLPTQVLDAPLAPRVLHGQQLPAPAGAPAGPTALLGPGGDLIAVAEVFDGRWRYLAVFGCASHPDR